MGGDAGGFAEDEHTVAQGPNGTWHWRCHRCGWVGMDCPDAVFAAREWERHHCPELSDTERGQQSAVCPEPGCDRWRGHRGPHMTTEQVVDAEDAGGGHCDVCGINCEDCREDFMRGEREPADTEGNRAETFPIEGERKETSPELSDTERELPISEHDRHGYRHGAGPCVCPTCTAARKLKPPQQETSTNLTKRFDLRDRQTGKTTDLLAWLRAAPEGEHRIYVGHSNEAAMQVYRSTFVDGVSDLESWQFVGLREVTRDAWGGVLRGRGGRIVLGLDNLDLMLGELLGWPVGRATINDA